MADPNLISGDGMRAIIETARKATAPTVLFCKDEQAQVVFAPFGRDGAGRVEIVDVEQFQERPARRKGTVRVFDAPSFNTVLLQNADAGDAAIYINRDPNDPAIIAVLNGDGPGGPGWSDFRVYLDLRQTQEWRKWRGLDGKMLPQIDFAEFVEDNLADIADPPGAEMLEIVTYLQATRNVEFKSGVRLSSGAVQLQNLESIDAKVSAGQIEVPQTITLGIAPFQGCARYSVPARFRYRIENGKLLLGVKLQRIEDLMRSVFDEIALGIVPPLGVKVLEGDAPLPR